MEEDSTLSTLEDFVLFLGFFLKDCIYFIFRRRGREGEIEGEKHQCVAASHIPHTGMCLTGNPIGDPLVRRLAFYPLSHTSQGSFVFSWWQFLEVTPVSFCLHRFHCFIYIQIQVCNQLLNQIVKQIIGKHCTYNPWLSGDRALSFLNYIPVL